jgi:hypothetical protein
VLRILQGDFKEAVQFHAQIAARAPGMAAHLRTPIGANLKFLPMDSG